MSQSCSQVTAYRWKRAGRTSTLVGIIGQFVVHVGRLLRISPVQVPTEPTPGTTGPVVLSENHYGHAALGRNVTYQLRALVQARL